MADGRTGGPAPSRAAVPGAFAPRGAVLGTRARRYARAGLLAAASLPVAAVVGASAITADGLLGLLLYPTAIAMGLLIGALTPPSRHPFGGAFASGWAGYFAGTLIGVADPYATSPGLSGAGIELVLLIGAVGGAFLGIFLGLLEGIAAAFGSWARRGLLRTWASSPPRA